MEALKDRENTVKHVKIKKSDLIALVCINPYCTVQLLSSPICQYLTNWGNKQIALNYSTSTMRYVGAENATVGVSLQSGLQVSKAGVLWQEPGGVPESWLILKGSVRRITA